jgi:hypothetical protein
LQIENGRFMLCPSTSCMLSTETVQNLLHMQARLWLVTSNVSCMFFSVFKFGTVTMLIQSFSDQASRHARAPHPRFGSLICFRLREFEVTATPPCWCCNSFNIWALRVG